MMSEQNTLDSYDLHKKVVEKFENLYADERIKEYDDRVVIDCDDYAVHIEIDEYGYKIDGEKVYLSDLRDAVRKRKIELEEQFG